MDEYGVLERINHVYVDLGDSKSKSKLVHRALVEGEGKKES